MTKSNALDASFLPLCGLVPLGLLDDLLLFRSLAKVLC